MQLVSLVKTSHPLWSGRGAIWPPVLLIQPLDLELRLPQQLPHALQLALRPIEGLPRHHVRFGGLGGGGRAPPRLTILLLMSTWTPATGVAHAALLVVLHLPLEVLFANPYASG